MLECQLFDILSGLLIETVDLKSEPNPGDKIFGCYQVVSVSDSDESDLDVTVKFL